MATSSNNGGDDDRDPALDHDELDPAPVPDPDDAPTTAERARARAFGELIDKVVAGRPPPAMAADDRALVEVATVIRAATGRVELAEARRTALVEQALRQAIDGRPARASSETAPPATRPERGDAPVGGGGGDVVPIGAARPARRWRDDHGPTGRLAKGAPWLVAAVSTVVAAAAVLVLVLRPAERSEPATSPAARRLPVEQTSRPADPLVGAIPRERADDAVSRIDAIFADRLDGWRARGHGRGPVMTTRTGGTP